MDSFWHGLLGSTDVWVRPVICVALFTIALYIFARPPKREHLSQEETQQQRIFLRMMVSMVIVFAILLYWFVDLTGLR